MNLMKLLVCMVVVTLLAFILSPGVLLTLPPQPKGKMFLALKDDKDNMSTSYTASAVHAVVLAVVLLGISKVSGVTC